MPATRSKPTGKKIKFSDDGEAPEGAEIQSAPSPEPTQPSSESEGESEDSEDSDEAPEEESVSQSKSAHLQKTKELQRRQQEARKQEKEKRKQQDLHFREQQELKREKLRELASADSLPDLLPEEALESDEDEKDEAVSRSSKHLRSEDFEKEDAAMRKKAKLEKLRNLKSMRQSALKKGPVYVQVNGGSSKNRVPRAEQSVLDSKSQWMQRESLNRK